MSGQWPHQTSKPAVRDDRERYCQAVSSDEAWRRPTISAILRYWLENVSTTAFAKFSFCAVDHSPQVQQSSHLMCITNVIGYVYILPAVTVLWSSCLLSTDIQQAEQSTAWCITDFSPKSPSHWARLHRHPFTLRLNKQTFIRLWQPFTKAELQRHRLQSCAKHT